MTSEAFWAAIRPGIDWPRCDAGCETPAITAAMDPDRHLPAFFFCLRHAASPLILIGDWTPLDGGQAKFSVINVDKPPGD